MRATRPWVAMVVVVAFGLGACSSDGRAGDRERSVTTTARDPGGRTTTTPHAGGAPGPGGVDRHLTRDDVNCGELEEEPGPKQEFIDGSYVVEGVLGANCYGEPDPTTVRAWKDLVAFVPPGQLTDLGLFAGFVDRSSGDQAEASGTTLAFVNTLDDDGSTFQMSVNLDEYDADPDEALLTMAHEFSHVFTATPGQIDRAADAEERCDTYWNGEGCYLPDSLMAEWIDRFWVPSDLADVDPDADVGVDDGEPRCAANPSYLGPYAATTPEEDFAETFSAFVFGVEAPTPEVQAKLDWMAQQPGLVEFRERASGAGLSPLEGSFEGCGS